MQRVVMRHPADDTRVGRQRTHRVALNVEVALGGLHVMRQQRVDEAEELHDALVLAQILVALEQKVVRVAVRAKDGELARALLRGDDGQRGRERLDRHHVLAGSVGAGHTQLQAGGIQQARRNVLQLERRQLA